MAQFNFNGMTTSEIKKIACETPQLGYTNYTMAQDGQTNYNRQQRALRKISRGKRSLSDFDNEWRSLTRTRTPSPVVSEENDGDFNVQFVAVVSEDLSLVTYKRQSPEQEDVIKSVLGHGASLVRATHENTYQYIGNPIIFDPFDNLISNGSNSSSSLRFSFK